MSGAGMKNALARPEQTGMQRRDTANEIRGLLESNRGELMKALPKASGLTPDRLTRIAVTVLRTNEMLQQCSIGSLMASLITVAQLGLDPMPATGHAYLVPYKRKLGNEWVYECQLIIGYRGLMSLARRSGEVVSIEAHIVHANDGFEWEQGSESRVRHVPTKLGGDPGEPVGVFAVARLRDGTTVHDVLRLDDIERARKSSKAQGGPWDAHWGEMARKTAVRRLAKYLPLTAEVAAALEADESVVLDVGKALDVREEKPRLVTIDPPVDDDPDDPFRGDPRGAGPDLDDGDGIPD